MTISQTREDQELEALYRDLAAVDLRPLWTITEQLLTPTPKPKAIPWLWSAATMKPLLSTAFLSIQPDANSGAAGGCAKSGAAATNARQSASAAANGAARRIKPPARARC